MPAPRMEAKKHLLKGLINTRIDTHTGVQAAAASAVVFFFALKA